MRAIDFVFSFSFFFCAAAIINNQNANQLAATTSTATTKTTPTTIHSQFGRKNSIFYCVFSSARLNFKWLDFEPSTDRKSCSNIIDHSANALSFTCESN